jgi:hypothetical protein
VNHVNSTRLCNRLFLPITLSQKVIQVCFPMFLILRKLAVQSFSHVDVISTMFFLNIAHFGVSVVHRRHSRI